MATFLPWGIASSFVTPAEGAGGWGAPGRSELVMAAGDSREQEQQRQQGTTPHTPCPAPPGESIKSEAPAASSQPPQHPWESLSQTPPQLAGTPRRLLPPSGKRPAAEPLRAIFQQLPRLQEAPAASWQLLDVPGGPGGARCPPGARKQPAASPSQVAMASFSSPSPAPPAEKRRLTIFNRIQVGSGCSPLFLCSFLGLFGPPGGAGLVHECSDGVVLVLKAQKWSNQARFSGRRVGTSTGSARRWRKAAGWWHGEQLALKF